MQKDVQKKQELENGLEISRIRRESLRKKQMEDMRECTFQPNISKTRKSLPRKNSLRRSLEHVEKLHNWQNDNLRHKLELQAIRVEEEAEKIGLKRKVLRTGARSIEKRA